VGGKRDERIDLEADMWAVYKPGIGVMRVWSEIEESRKSGVEGDLV